MLILLFALASAVLIAALAIGLRSQPPRTTNAAQPWPTARRNDAGETGW